MALAAKRENSSSNRSSFSGAGRPWGFSFPGIRLRVESVFDHEGDRYPWSHAAASDAPAAKVSPREPCAMAKSQEDDV